MKPTLIDRLMSRYLDRLVASPRGRAHLLNQLADAESNGEGAVFDRLLERVEDPELKKLIARHASDEVMHAEMFRTALARTGVPMGPAPDHLKMIDRLDRATDSLFDKGIQSDLDVMKAYVLLQVVEERATEQFAVFQKVFEKYDPETAKVIGQIIADEERHLKYCRAIAKRYAPDARTLEDALTHYRAVEAVVFAANSKANMAWCLEQDYLAIGPVEKVFWRGVAKVTERVEKPRTTRFWDKGTEPATIARYAGAAGAAAATA